MNKLINPYVYGPPVQDPNLFFGRDYELSVVLNTISHSAPGLRQSMAIVGPRRIGKSSLLFQVYRRLKEEKNSTALISTESFVDPLPFSLTQEILGLFRADAIQKGLPQSSVSFDLLDQPAPPESQVYQVFRRDLRRLNEVLAEKRQPPAILMIDEVEGLSDFGGYRVFGLFRDLAQTFPYVMLIVAGSDKLYQLINDNTSPFFNVFKTVSIAPLSREDSEAAIREPAQRVGLAFDVASVERVVELSGGVPHLINMTCHTATEIALAESRSTITTQHIGRAAQRILINERGYFQYTWDRVKGLERLVLYVLAQEEDFIQLDELLATIGELTDYSEPLSPIPSLLLELVERQVLSKKGESAFMFINQLIPQWIKAHRTLSDVIDEHENKRGSDSNEKQPELESMSLDNRLSILKANLSFVQNMKLDSVFMQRLQSQLTERIALIESAIYRSSNQLAANLLEQSIIALDDNEYKKAMDLLSQAEKHEPSQGQLLEAIRSTRIKAQRALYMLEELEKLEVELRKDIFELVEHFSEEKPLVVLIKEASKNRIGVLLWKGKDLKELSLFIDNTNRLIERAINDGQLLLRTKPEAKAVLGPNRGFTVGVDKVMVKKLVTEGLRTLKAAIYPAALAALGPATIAGAVGFLTVPIAMLAGALFTLGVAATQVVAIANFLTTSSRTLLGLDTKVEQLFQILEEIDGIHTK